MTGTDIVTNRVRFILHDTVVASYIWSNDLLTAFLKDGVTLITTRLPESMLTAPNTAADFVWSDITDLTTTLPLAERYANALVHYVAYRALSQDGLDKRDLKRAGEMAAAFTGETGIQLQ